MYSLRHRTHLPCTARIEIGRSRLISFDVRLLQSHQCDVNGVHKNPSAIAHSQARMGFFESQEFTKWDVIGYNYRYGWCSQCLWCSRKRPDGDLSWTIPYRGDKAGKRSFYFRWNIALWLVSAHEARLSTVHEWRSTAVQKRCSIRWKTIKSTFRECQAFRYNTCQVGLH